MHSGMFIVVYMELMFTCIPGLSLSLFSLWFCLESQSAMKRSGPGLYIILPLYWCILRRIHCSHVYTHTWHVIYSYVHKTLLVILLLLLLASQIYNMYTMLLMLLC